MFKNPVFHFNASTDTGIDEIPLDSLVYIKDSDGSGTAKQVLKTDGTGLTGTSTIADFLGNTALWKEVPGGDPDTVVSDITGITGASKIDNIVKISQTDYDNLGSYDSATLYIIT